MRWVLRDRGLEEQKVMVHVKDVSLGFSIPTPTGCGRLKGKLELLHRSRSYFPTFILQQSGIVALVPVALSRKQASIT